ncbi:MAG TPA: chloride channel protein [Myxococcaceae bacterium]|nr:chloride channel protein [Myxococcaceae bacterium]
MNLSRGARSLAQWLLLGSLVGAACGVASALFLALLDEATALRERHCLIVYTLPLAGLVIGALYAKWGAPIRGGNNLVLDTVHEGDGQLPLRMAPMVLVGTVLTHLFGGSAGREGTAVQMGSSLADAIAAAVPAGAPARASYRARRAHGLAAHGPTQRATAPVSRARSLSRRGPGRSPRG